MSGGDDQDDAMSIATILKRLLTSGGDEKRDDRREHDLRTPNVVDAASNNVVQAPNEEQIGAVFARARLIAATLASLRFQVYRLEGNERRIDTDNDLHRLLVRRPNDQQTPSEFIEELVFDAAMNGDGFAIKNVVGDKIKELIPVKPCRVTLRQANRQLPYYEVGTMAGILKVHRDQMFRLRRPMGGAQFSRHEPNRAICEAIEQPASAEESLNQVAMKETFHNIGTGRCISEPNDFFGNNLLHALHIWGVRFAQTAARDLGNPECTLGAEFEINGDDLSQMLSSKDRFD